MQCSPWDCCCIVCIYIFYWWVFMSVYCMLHIYLQWLTLWSIVVVSNSMLQKRCKTDEFCFRKRRQRQKKSKARCWQVELQGMRGGGEIAGLIIAGSLSYQLPPVSVQLWRSKRDEHFQLWSDEHFHFPLTPHSLPTQRCSPRLGRSLDQTQCRLWKGKQMWTECEWVTDFFRDGERATGDKYASHLFRP